MKFISFKKYLVITTKELFHNHFDSLKSIHMDNIVIKDNEVRFYTNRLIEIDGFESYNRYLKFIKKFVLPNTIFILGIIIAFIVFFLTPNYVREVKYQNGSIKDESVYNDVLTSLNDSLIDSKLDVNLNELSKQLMITYPHYSWISVRKNGSVIYLNIELNSVNFDKIDFSKLPGDLISGYDAYIKSISIIQGKTLVDINQVVKKGDTLVSGNLNLTQSLNNDGKLVSSKGVIIGEIVYTKIVKVRKQNTINSFNGNLKQARYLKIGNFSFKKPKVSFELYKSYEDIIFNIGNIIEIIDLYYYETTNVLFEYTKDEAINYAKSVVYYEMEKNRTSDLEKVTAIDVLNVTEDSDYYTIKLLVKEDKNIVVFKQY